MNWLVWKYFNIIKRSSIINLAIFGISLSICSIIIINSIVNGLQADFIERLISVVPNIELMSKSDLNTDIFKYDKAIESFYKYTKMHAAVSGLYGLVGIEVRAIDLKSNNYKNPHVLFDGIKRLKDCPNGIILGSALANNIGLRLGSKIVLFFTNKNNQLSKQEFILVGILNTGIKSIDSHLSLANMDNLKGPIRISIALKNKLRSKEIAEHYRSLFNGKVLVSDWITNNPALFAAFNSERYCSILIIFIIVLMSGTILSTSSYYILDNKRYEYTLMLAMGIKHIALVYLFFINSLIIIGVGCLFGLLLSALLLKGISIFNMLAYAYGFIGLRIPLLTDYKSSAFLIFLSLLVNTLFMIAPSCKLFRYDLSYVLRTLR